PMPPRDMARAARRSIDVAQARLRAGDVLLVFAEGTRSRTREMQPVLAGVARYLDDPEAWVLPVGIVGTDAMFPIGEDGLHRVRIDIRIGAPIQGRTLRQHAGADRRLMMDAAGLAIADLLPAEYRGHYGDRAVDLSAARRVLSRARSTGTLNRDTQG
ncbi:MAG: lysophospholipid acyltransferase family protein, partial [Acidobacteriota bacterium]